MTAPAEPRHSPSGIPLPPHLDSPTGESPGVFPFTRGIHDTMYRGRPWTMRQYSGFGTATETNRRLRYLLDQGQTGLSVAFDLPTQIGHDSTAPEAAGEVGKVGVPISTLEDMDQLLEGIPLDSVSISMTINASAAVLLAFLVALASKRGVDPARLRGTLQNDILKEFVARHTQRFPVDPSMRLVLDVLEYSTTNLPLWNPISVSGYHIREAGSTAVEELAITLSHAIAYMEGARDRGIALTTLARRVSFFFNAQMDLFEEVAKFRAARRLWARIARDRLGIDDPVAARMRFHTQTAGAALTYHEPENNVVRVTVQALAAVLGGTQSLHTNALDEALGLPTEDTVRTALRTQQILLHETGIADVADPLGGAPLVELLTDSIEQRATQLLARIDAAGGALQAVEEGLTRSWIEASSYSHQQAVERGDQVVVGVNRHVSPGEGTHDGTRFRADSGLEETRIRSLTERKAARLMGPINAAVENLKKAASGSENLMEPLIGCVEAGASMSEMMGAMATVFGEYQGGF